jgi:hypothetical protein
MYLAMITMARWMTTMTAAHLGVALAINVLLFVSAAKSQGKDFDNSSIKMKLCKPANERLFTANILIALRLLTQST